MGIQYNTLGNLCAQTGALSGVEVLSRLIARIEAFDDPIDVVAVSDFEERP